MSTAEASVNHNLFPLTVLCHPRCSTCKKALAWLDNHGIAYVWRSIIEENPTVDELNRWTHATDLPIRRFFNTSGNVYRENKVKNTLDDWEKTLSPEQFHDHAVQLLSTDGMMCKRPIVLSHSGDFLTVGFKESVWEQIFLN
ncbi:arsenate reductase family protein [Alloscardovia criceti]|uniref:arsenate reductase family protein n=1 Tax=Alloscardovia criceti TaxID=356828 RepID=UPI00035DB26C|nr:arsenate reductase family protein [Alloscardovia criceti]